MYNIISHLILFNCYLWTNIKNYFWQEQLKQDNSVGNAVFDND